MSASSPLIGITMYGANADNEYRLPEEYISAVRRAGGVAVLVPPGDTNSVRVLSALQGLILAGGGDICPSRYGGQGHPTIYSIDAARDESEIALAQAALARKIPLLAICRGLQLLNVVLGGTLHPHVPDVYGEQVAHRNPPRVPVLHPVTLEADSRIAARLGTTEVTCVSWHHQAVDRIAASCRAVARAPDGLVEALELQDRDDVLAVQWHPELSAAEDPQQQELFDQLVRDARRYNP